MTDEKRLALLHEYLSSGMLKTPFEKEKGLSKGCISNWLRIFAVEDKPVLPPQVTVTDMKNDPDKEELLQEIARLKQELRFRSLELKRIEMARDAPRQSLCPRLSYTYLLLIIIVILVKLLVSYEILQVYIKQPCYLHQRLQWRL
ncbi:MAG: hypothetical protein K5683_01660 [Prevotella sp.]|nr:hypothetical protein [Prevotella sp.]